MQKTIPMRKEGASVRLELTAEDLIHQTQKILEIKNKAMKEGVHYGVIPGCQKPSLWKPGAEKMCQAFRLQSEFETVCREDPDRTITWKKWDYKNKKEVEGTTRGYVEYESRCSLIHIPTGEAWAKHVSGACNNFESRYRSMNPNDVKNTLAKMSEKRSMVAAVLIGTAASDIFTQDIEDMPQLINGDNEPLYNGNGVDNGKSKNGDEDKPRNGRYANSETRTATERQVGYIKSQLDKNQVSENEFFQEWKDYFDTWDTIPFNIVNDILKWIKEE